MNGERQMIKTPGKENIQPNVRKVLASVKTWKCKTIYPTIKTVRFALDLLTTNKHDGHAGWVKRITSPGEKIVSGISMVTFFPPWIRKSQLSLSLPLPILLIYLFLESSPLPLTCEQGAGSVGRRQLALRFAYLCALFFLFWAAVARCSPPLWLKKKR